MFDNSNSNSNNNSTVTATTGLTNNTNDNSFFNSIGHSSLSPQQDSSINVMLTPPEYNLRQRGQANPDTPSAHFSYADNNNHSSV